MSGLLVVAPHPDDEALGAGGVIIRAARAGEEVTVLTVAAHMPPLYSSEAHQRSMDEALRAHEVLGVTRSIFLDLPAVLINQRPVHELNDTILATVREVEPTVVLAPFPDRHIDHRCVFAAVMVATRPFGAGAGIASVASYETVSETHWNAPGIEPGFTPNWVEDIGDVMDLKLAALACYRSQMKPFPAARSLEAVKALATFRGSQAGFAFGEAYQIIRMVNALSFFIGPGPDRVRPAAE